MEEIWKNIEELDNVYQVSNLGRCRSMDRTVFFEDGRVRRYKGRILKPTDNGNGYKMLKTNKPKVNLYVHRLVAKYFIKNEDPLKNVVNHLNHDKSDNRVENLEWCTQQHNIKHSLHLMRNNARYTPDEVAKKIISDLKLGLSITEAATANNVSYTVAYYIKTNRSFNHLKKQHT